MFVFLLLILIFILKNIRLGKFVKTLGKYADNVLGTTTKVTDDVTYTPEQLSNYNYAIDMSVPGVKKQNPGNLDEFLSGSFNKMPVYRTVDLNTDVIKQQPVIDDMISKMSIDLNVI